MKDFLDKASTAYYEGSPVLSDSEFDRLAQLHGYNAVGYTVTDATPHLYPMHSLQKIFDIDNAPDLDGYVRSPKLDGAAVSLLYVGGELVLALTRGDGKQGRDITDKMRKLVPTSVPYTEMFQITGEVVAPTSIPNSRNYAAGALNTKDIEDFRTKDLTFVAYDSTLEKDHTWTEAMSRLKGAGFKEVCSFNASQYPTDGEVYRVNSYSEFQALGYTSHHPRGAFALKEQKDGVVTTLLDVVWQVGRSGVVSPVAVLEPVLIGDATVRRATLHNIQYIRELGLQIGCDVEVIRSGEIIPRIVRRV